MLKTLSLSPDEAVPDGTPQGDSNEDAPANNSESRMLRALEAMSNHQPDSPTRGREPSRDPGAFRPGKPPQRDGFRDSGSNSAPHSAPFGGKPRHRFVKDGEIPVVHVAPPRPRDPAGATSSRNDPEWIRLQQAVDEQRVRADQSERARAELVNQLRVLQTKLAHTELALGDATALAQSRLDEINAAQAAMREAVPPPAYVKQATQKPDDGAPKRPRGRPRLIRPPVDPAPEPEPVQWWLAPVKSAKRRMG